MILQLLTLIAILNPSDIQENVEALLMEPASLVNPVSCDTAQVLPILQNILIQNDIQRVIAI